MRTFMTYRPAWHALAGVVASAALLALYARGGYAWVLGFALLLPWLLALNSASTFGGALASGWLMSVAYIAAVFPWFAAALDAYTGMGTVSAMLLLCAFAPLLQPQVLVFAVVRHLVRARHGVLLAALAGASAVAALAAALALARVMAFTDVVVAAALFAGIGDLRDLRACEQAAGHAQHHLAEITTIHGHVIPLMSGEKAVE